MTTRIAVCPHTFIHTDTHILTNMQIYIYTRTQTYTNRQTHTDKSTNIYAYRQTHTPEVFVLASSNPLSNAKPPFRLE